MEDINNKISLLNSYKKTNFLLFSLMLIFFSGIVLWYFTLVNSTAEYVILSYFSVNLFVCYTFLFKNIIPKTNNLTPVNPEKYFEYEIDRTIVSNDIAPIVFIIPMMLFFVAALSMNKIYNFKIELAIFISIPTILFIFLYYWMRIRKFLRKEYKNIHGIDFLSFFFI